MTQLKIGYISKQNTPKGKPKWAKKNSKKCPTSFLIWEMHQNNFDAIFKR